ncbi:hypothetical protein GW17_00054890 [Ensete ventricosum]|nr:hypothetical protein GW17_00054890 [Ensete ventricosum]RZR84237.1 hypothetical protein BHM03_00011004 [Ensete ventricosum]
MEVRMTKKMRKIAKEPSSSTSCSSFGDDARQRFKHQSLLQDYMELLKVIYASFLFYYELYYQLQKGEEMEFQSKQDTLKMGKLKRCSMNGGGSNDFKLAMCRDVGNNSNRVSKRKISWQDQVALEA